MQDFEFNAVADRMLGNRLDERLALFPLLAVNFQNNVILHKPGFIGRRTRNYGQLLGTLAANNQNAVRDWQFIELGETGSNRDITNAQPRPHDAASRAHTFNRPLDAVNGNSKANKLTLARDRGVDADHFAGKIKERPARVAGIDRGVGLNRFFDDLAQAAAISGLDPPP